MSVHYKFKSSKDYDTLTFDGLHISVEELKKAILQQKKMRTMSDFDLEITNAQTKEVYADNSALIPKNSSVVVVRVPITSQPKKHWERHDNNSTAYALDRSSSSSFGNGKLSRTADLVNANASESEKILAMMSQSSADYDPSKYVRNSSMNGPLPPNYLCHRCGKPGHWIKYCPTNSDVKRSTGIPRSFMVQVDGPDHKGAYLTSSGHFAVPAIDHAAYKDVKKDPKREVVEVKEEVPPDLICSLCKNIYVDAVLIPCCGESFCDECIRQLLLDSETHECPVCHEENVSPDNLIPIRSLRNNVKNYLNKTSNRNGNLNAFQQSAINNSQVQIPPVAVPPPNVVPNEAAIVNQSVDPATQPVVAESSPIVPASVVVNEPPLNVNTLEAQRPPTHQMTVIPDGNQNTVSVTAPHVGEGVSNVEDDRPGTPLADEVPVPVEPIPSAGVVQNISTILPPISNIKIAEPQPPGISDDLNPSPIQTIATVTTRGPSHMSHYQHQTGSSPFHPRGRYPRAGFRPPRSRYTYRAPHYTGAPSTPAPGAFPDASHSQAPSFPAPSQVPPASSVLPPGTTYASGIPYNPADFSNPYGVYSASSSIPSYNYATFEPDPYNEFHRKMREKEARERYRRRTRSRSRSRSTSSFSSRSYSRSRSRSFSRSLSPRSFSRSRSRSRTPPRFRRKILPQRYDSKFSSKRRSRSPLPGYRHSPPHHRPFRPPEYSVNYYGDPYYGDKVPPYTGRLSPRSDRAPRLSDHYDSRSPKYDIRDYKSVPHEHRDRPIHSVHQPRSHHDTPIATDKYMDKRSPSRKDPHSSHSQKPKDATRKAEKYSKTRHSTSPKSRNSPLTEKITKVKSSSDERKDKSDSERHKKKKHRENKVIASATPDSTGNEISTQNSESKVNNSEKPQNTSDLSEKLKKHKHKKHRQKDKESNLNKKKKRKKAKGIVTSTTTDTEGDLRNDKQLLVVDKPKEPEKSPIAEISNKDAESRTTEVASAQPFQSDSEPGFINEKDQTADENNQALAYMPELSKWERDDIDEAPVVGNLPSYKQVQRELKQPLSSEIIQRAEKAILLKTPKPSTVTLGPVIPKGNISKTDNSKIDKHNRIVFDTENIKITIPNNENLGDKSSRKSADKPKLPERGNDSNRQSSIIVVKDKLDLRNQNVETKDLAREKHRHQDKNSDSGRSMRSHSPQHRERKHEESSRDSRTMKRRNDDRQLTSEKSVRKDSPKKKGGNEPSSYFGNSSGNVKSHKQKYNSDEKKLSPHDLREKLNKDSDEQKISPTGQITKEASTKDNVLEDGEIRDYPNHKITIIDQKPQQSIKTNSSPVDTMIQEDESNFVPDYDGPSHSECSSDDDEAEEKNPKISVKTKNDQSVKFKSSDNGSHHVKYSKKRKYSEDSSDSSSSSESSHPKKLKHHHSSDRKKSKKHKKNKKHKKHKKKKSKSKHSRSEKSKWQ